MVTPCSCKCSLFVSPRMNQSSSFKHVFHATRLVVRMGIVPLSNEKCMAAPNTHLVFPFLPSSIVPSDKISRIKSKYCSSSGFAFVTVASVEFSLLIFRNICFLIYNIYIDTLLLHIISPFILFLCYICKTLTIPSKTAEKQTAEPNTSIYSIKKNGFLLNFAAKFISLQKI